MTEGFFGTSQPCKKWCEIDLRDYARRTIRDEEEPAVLLVDLGDCPVTGPVIPGELSSQLIQKAGW